MRSNIVGLVFLAVMVSSVSLIHAQDAQLHRLDFKSAKQLHRFFKYKSGKAVISGHRGTVELGLPENSIAGMEAVLMHTPAFFEIDPRLTKDSIVILMHDATLDRTTNGTGKVADYTWAELQQLRLKDKDGNLTEHRIPTLSEVIEWARGKTVLNLDQKDVPVEVSADLIRKHNAYAFVMVTVHSPEQARFYLDKHKHQMLSAHIQTREKFDAYKNARIPFNRMIAYIGPHIKPENRAMYQLLNREGVMCMISSAPTYDKLPTRTERAAAYRAIFADGASILESDLPIEAGEALIQAVADAT
ncbi:glycerophosphodiester phosphodiesterase family protein [Parapedobacter deserti]|uniref:Glycerophosphodiester phosphodiesterase family protein n=1 Tax=Parapedobacter deserti TaxID=1912957 RepID=A0ABV7JJX0_9SPHI